MIRFLGFYKRRPDLTHEQCLHHWKTVHGPLIARTPGGDRYLKKYIQHHLSKDPAGPGDFPYDCFSEAWFESLEAREAFVALRHVQNEVIPDEQNFLDLAATRWMVIDDLVLQLGNGEWPHPIERGSGL
jgi:uncharacterized protein (TIGR02118 family)